MESRWGAVNVESGTCPWVRHSGVDLWVWGSGVDSWVWLASAYTWNAEEHHLLPPLHFLLTGISCLPYIPSAHFPPDNPGHPVLHLSHTSPDYSCSQSGTPGPPLCTWCSTPCAASVSQCMFQQHCCFAFDPLLPLCILYQSAYSSHSAHFNMPYCNFDSLYNDVSFKPNFPLNGLSRFSVYSLLRPVCFNL